MKVAVVLAAVFALVAAGAATYAYRALRTPYAGFGTEVFVEIDRGVTTRRIARELAARGVIEHEWPFLLGRALRPKAVLQAGEYRFARPASVWEVQQRLIRGDVYYHSFTVPEGSNIFDTATIVASLDWVGEAAVKVVVKSPELIADLDPRAENLEGYLFPSTYLVTRGTPAVEICRMMTDEFRRVWGALGADADVRETVTLASLIEKETGRAGERKLISSVFHNRLRRGMRLECDPTVIYAAILEQRYDGTIHRSDLASRNPYNTYEHAGLPPGPIASPGRAAIEAALHPAATDYLFFVARPDGSGGHEFSKNLAAHNRAVARYRRAIRQAKRESKALGVLEQSSAGTSN